MPYPVLVPIGDTELTALVQIVRAKAESQSSPVLQNRLLLQVSQRYIEVPALSCLEKRVDLPGFSLGVLFVLSLR